MRIITFLFVLFLISIFSSCVVRSPRYSEISQVLKIQLGMSLQEVAQIMETPPYDLKSVNENGEFVYIYKYRVEETRRIPYLMKRNKGLKTLGKYVDLFVFFSKEGKVVKIESCSECEKVEAKQTKININHLLTLIATTLPIILLYLNLQ